MTPTARSLVYLRKEGYLCAITEHWNPFSHTRQDLYGIIDIVAIHPDHNGVLGIQATSTGNVAARRHKILANPAIKVWLQAGNKLEIWGWSKKGKRGKVKHWTLTKKEIEIESI